nr:immunoglobulin heavy chain junction region [Macaca mulatta]
CARSSDWSAEYFEVW